MSNRASPTVSTISPARADLFPPLIGRTLGTALGAGIAADLTCEFWARVITPALPDVGGPPEPAGLVQSVFVFRSLLLCELIHLMVGFVFYPLGYLFIARPLQRAILPGLPWPQTAAGFGVGLWVFAFTSWPT